ncbi:MAG TPA: glycosyl hydrolase, partial [Phycisphaerae bacterium]|nr:glycosyl hydrolase [Phycisphaerae bacterium]
MHTQKLLAAAALFALAQTAAAQTAPELSWPTPTMENKLWSRWWWMGNAVDEKNLTRQLEQFQQAGLGGTEICPIYGVYGSENRYLNFLSPQWMSMLAHTARESKRLGIGLDMTTGTGWPFGGNMVTDTDASKGIVLKAFDRLPDLKEIPAGKPLYVMAYVPNQPAPTDITEPLLSGADIKPFPAGTRFVAALQTGP